VSVFSDVVDVGASVVLIRAVIVEPAWISTLKAG